MKIHFNLNLKYSCFFLGGGEVFLLFVLFFVLVGFFFIVPFFLLLFYCVVFEGKGFFSTPKNVL